jgi:hypothetical protein
MAQKRKFRHISFGLGLRWPGILPYYKRISFVLFLMYLYQYWIGLSARVGGTERVSRAMNERLNFIGGMVK